MKKAANQYPVRATAAFKSVHCARSNSVAPGDMMAMKVCGDSAEYTRGLIEKMISRMSYAQRCRIKFSAGKHAMQIDRDELE